MSFDLRDQLYAAATWTPDRDLVGLSRVVGRERLRRRRILVGGSAVIAAAALVLGVSLNPVWTRREAMPSGVPTFDGDRYSAFGVSLKLPADWTLTETSASAGQRRACAAGPASGQSGCAIQLLVSASPTDPAAQVDISHFMFVDRCDLGPTNPDGSVRSTVTSVTERLTVSGMSATHRTTRCRPTSSPVDGWILDNQKVAVVTDDPQLVPIADEIFRSIRATGDWPAPTNTPSPAAT